MWLNELLRMYCYTIDKPSGLAYGIFSYQKEGGSQCLTEKEKKEATLQVGIDMIFFLFMHFFLTMAWQRGSKS